MRGFRALGPVRPRAPRVFRKLSGFNLGRTSCCRRDTAIRAATESYAVEAAAVGAGRVALAEQAKALAAEEAEGEASLVGI